jgi:hypothetical protein
VEEQRSADLVWGVAFEERLTEIDYLDSDEDLRSIGYDAGLTR